MAENPLDTTKATEKKIAPLRSRPPKMFSGGSIPAPELGPLFAFNFKAGNDTFNWENPKVPSKVPFNNATTDGSKPLAQASTSTRNQNAAAAPPWKTTENLPRIPPPPQSSFRVDLLTANLKYLNKTYESYQSVHNWKVAQQCLLKMIKIMGRQSINAASLTNATRTNADTPAFSDTLDELEIKLFSSHLRLGEYEEAWKMLPALSFSSKSNAGLWKKAYEELLTTVGCLDRAFESEAEISETPSTEGQTQRSLFYQIEISCGKAIDAAIDGEVDIYGRPMKYQLYAIMAIIEHANQKQDEAVFWKTLVVVDEVDIEKDLVFFPLLAKWVNKYNDIQDITLESAPLAETNEAEQAKQEVDPKSGEKTDSPPEDSKVEFLSGTTFAELKEQLVCSLNEIKATLKQGLQDLKTERQEIEELKDEIIELKEEWQVDIDILQDEVDELRDEFGDRLLEELQEGLDPELSVGLRLESVRIANGRIAEMNKEVKERLNELEAELMLPKQQNESSEFDQLGLD